MKLKNQKEKIGRIILMSAIITIITFFSYFILVYWHNKVYPGEGAYFFQCRAVDTLEIAFALFFITIILTGYQKLRYNKEPNRRFNKFTKIGGILIVIGWAFLFWGFKLLELLKLNSIFIKIVWIYEIIISTTLLIIGEVVAVNKDRGKGVGVLFIIILVFINWLLLSFTHSFKLLFHFF